MGMMKRNRHPGEFKAKAAHEAPTQDMRVGDRFSALYVRDFRIFLTGQIISYSGTWMQSIAQGWLVYSLTKSPLYLGLVAAASNIPFLLFALVGGVFADRFAKRNLLIVTQALSILPALVLAASIDLKIITAREIAVAAFFLGMVNAFDIPARQSFLADMVHKGHLMNAVALNSAAFNAARIIGPIMAGITIAAAGIAACFYINAASFLAVIIALLMITGRKDAEIRINHGTDIPAFARDLFEGLRFVKKEKDIFRTIFLVAILSLFGVPFVTFLPVFAEDILRVGPQGLGFLAGSSGAGALCAALIIAFRGDIKRKGSYMLASGMVFGVSLIAFSLSWNFHLSAVALLFAGWGIVSFFATCNSFIQLSTPDRLRGRVMSVYTLVFFGMAPLGNSVIGAVADKAGAPASVAIGASVCLISITLLSGHLRVLR